MTTRLVVWSSTDLVADALGVLLDRDVDFEVVAAVGHDDVELSATLRSADLLVVHGVGIDRCRRLFARLDLTTQSSLVAVYLGSSGHSSGSNDENFADRIRSLGFAGVIDPTGTTETVVDEIKDALRLGPAVGVGATWTFEPDVPLEVLACPHCRDDRDVMILRFIVDGHTDSSIAELMSLNPQTIRNRVSNMLLESGMSNRTQLAIDFYRASLSLRGVDVPNLS